MTVHLQREIQNLKKKILGLSAQVEESVEGAVRAISMRDAKVANSILETDPEIDRSEVLVEEECLKILALHQPVAVDLRFIIAVLKINSDLERIGDLAVNVAEQAIKLAEMQEVGMPFDFPGMADKVQWMVNSSLDALVNMDAKLAREVCRYDDEVDAINRRMYGQVKEGIRGNIDALEQYIRLLEVSRNLERIADHATNIGEDVYYMIEGEIIRHRPDR